MSWVLVKDSVIINVIAYEEGSTYTPPDGCKLVQTDQWFDIGWGWDGTKPVEPIAPEETPAEQ